MNIDELFYNEALEKSLSLNSDSGTINIVDSTFLFAIKRFKVFEYSGSASEMSNNIVFDDLVSEETKNFK